jgi:hypothetical protein
MYYAMNTIKPFYFSLRLFAFVCLCAFTFIQCDDDDDNIGEDHRFTVTIENVSTNTTLQVGALPDRTAPLSPGLWAVYDDDSDNLFSVNSAADLGTERLAEEGMTDVKVSSITNSTLYTDHGEFSAPGGADNMPTIGAGESITFTFEASPGQQLQMMTMFGNSNDWFYAFGNGGLDLFNNGDPIDGNITSEIVLYDAGTELDEAPGLGLTQKPDHPTTIDVGADDPVTTIKEAIVRHVGFVIPATSNVMRVTISSVSVE